MLEQLMMISQGVVPIVDFDFTNAVLRSTAGPPGAPSAGSFHQAVTTVNSQMYSFGSYSGAGKTTAFRFAPGSGSVTLAALPTTIFGGLVVPHNGKLYNFGGTRGDSSTDFIIYDPTTNTYSREAAPGLPVAMHTILGYANGKIYMPQCNNTTNYYIYDIVTKTVETISLTSLGIPTIFERATIVVGDYAYSFGGRATRTTGATSSNVAYRMHLTTKVIELLPNLPTAAFIANNLFTNGNEIYIVAPISGASVPANIAMVLDLETLTWASHAVPSGLRPFSASCYISNRFYFLGGVIGSTEQTTGVSYSV